jgi:hypothetical protein
MNRIEYVKKMLQIMEDNPDMPIRINVGGECGDDDDARNFDIREFCGEPTIKKIYFIDGYIFGNEKDAKEYIVDDHKYCSLSNEELNEEIKKYSKDVIAIELMEVF